MNTFKNAMLVGVGTAPSGLYTVPSGNTATIIGLSVANKLTQQVYVDITLYDASASKSAYIGKNIPLPVGSSVIVVGGEHKIVLESGDSIVVNSNAEASVDVIMSILQIS